MAGCPSGATVKPGVDPTATIIVDRSTWATMVGAATTWFDEWLAFLQPKEMLVSDLVAANPNDPPLPSPAELISAISPPYLGIPAVLDYMLAKLTYYEFTQVAVCNGVPGVGYCTTRTFTPSTYTSNVGTACGSNSGWLFYSTDAVNQFPAGQHYLHVTMTDPAPSTGCCFSIYGDQDLTEHTHSFSAGQSIAFDRSFDSLSHWFEIMYRSNDGTNTWLLGKTLKFEFKNAYFEPVCTGSTTPPPTPSTPTQPTTIVLPPTLSCGTTADLCTAVRQLDQRLTQIYNLVTIIQRHSVPFAYVPGAVHSGLTGTGSFAISGLLGLRVQLSSTHPGEPILPGNPPYLWDQGWLSVNDSNGLLEEKRLTRTGMEWFPKFCETATSFNWSVAAGVVMVVTELEAET